MIHLHIQKIMDEKGLTPADIAPKMNISVRSIYRTIRAQRCPDLRDLVYFAEALGVSIEELYTVEYDENKNKIKITK